ncbi:MAG: PIN domain-containing protein [Bacteroidia bacterium]
MNFLLDTNIIIRHFSGLGKIGAKAKTVIIQAELNEHNLIVSVISLMEIMYLAEKKRIPVSLKETIEVLKSKSCYTIIELNTEIIIEAQNVSFYELHDRLLLATAKYLNIPILSSEKKFKEVKGITVVWS